jgi:NADH-quinone oxidoreductase subunit N
MFSLAGVPPMMGFAAKFAVLQAVLSTGAVWLTVVAVLFSLIGAYYYLRVVKVMWFDEPTESAALAVPFDMRATLTVNGIAVVVLGIYAGPLLAACMRAMSATLGS